MKILCIPIHLADLLYGRIQPIQLTREGLYLIKFVLPMSSLPCKFDYRRNTRRLTWLFLWLAIFLPVHGRLDLALAQQETPTETATETFTLTPSETVDWTPTATETPALAGTFTATPPTPPTLTPSPGFTATPTATLTPTPTTTLAPLPEITLLFPVFTPTVPATSSPEGAVLTAEQVVDDRSTMNQLPADVKWVGILVILIWLLLGGFLVAFIRYFTR